jgi:hypothetical protein
MENYLVRAIHKLKPESEFSLIDNDYSTIKWDILDGSAPTQDEIDSAIEQIKMEEISKAAAKAHERAALLERLGITEEEAALLLGGN